tara:strand:+ start:7276 stop:13653 length:6378 start_codon:yes stop_codon:yes gene_type:complete
MAKTQIKNYVFKPGMSATGYVYPNAYALLWGNKYYLQKEAVAWIAAQVTAGATGFSGYTYSVTQWETEIGKVIDAWAWDLRYGGNEETRKVASDFWEGTVSQFDGDRQAEVKTYEKIRDIIRDFLFTNSAYSGNQTQVIQTTDTTGDNAEAGAIVRINELAGIVINVINLGLDQLPVLVDTGVGNIKVQGRWGLDELLLVTNTTKNEIIYNFSNAENGGTAKLITKGYDSDFGTYLQTTDAITRIYFNYNTTSHDATDHLQVFVEKVENGKSVVQVRPYDFGTDAIERMRIAHPLSMLDADFEYGLQPTKWSAIGTLRGYPSVYEIPATNTAVQNVTTDASTGTGGIGASLITVTTVVAHGFEDGQPITIKALEDSVVGAARAEGSFVINSVTGDKTFNYYAKAKVGTNNGEVLVTTYCQLRKAGFYTGASISQPTFTIASNGSSGSFTTQLAVASGSTILPFDGAAPEVGSPLTQASIPAGSQVTQIIDTSAGGGTFLTLTTTANAAPNTDTLQVTDTAGLATNMAVDRGDGTAIYVQTIGTGASGLGVQFSGNFVNTRIGNVVNYTEISGSNVSANGADATFNISPSGDSSNTYVLNSVANGGYGYVVGDTIKVLGNLLGGETPANDATIFVTSVNSDGDVNTATISGLSFNGFAILTPLSHNPYGNAGTNASFNVEYLNTTYTGVTISNGGSGYVVGDSIVLGGDVIQPTGGSATHNNYVTVNTVSSGGEILSLTNLTQTPTNRTPGTYSGVTASSGGGGATFDIIVQPAGGHKTMTNFGASDASRTAGTYTNVSGTSTGSGVVGTFDITVNAIGAVLSVVVKTIGSGHSVSDTITIQDSSLGGGGAAAFTMDVGTISTAGDIDLEDITIATPGLGNAQGSTVTIADSVLGNGGASAITFDVGSVGLAGRITGIAFTTTNAPQRDETFTNVAFTSNTAGGDGNATFTVQVTGASYQVTGGGGLNYLVGETFTIAGNATGLGGSSPINDITGTIASVDANGAILTYTTTGTAVNGRTALGIVGSNRQGTGATFRVELGEGDYTVDLTDGIQTPGSGYAVGQQLVIPGSNLRGASPANDATITVTQVSNEAAGAITAITIAGTASQPTGPYNSVAGTNVPNTGTNATFNIRRNFSSYDNITVFNGGSGYKVGDRINIPGTTLDGASPLHDLELYVDAVGGDIITAVTGTYTIANPGTNIDIISTVTMSEATTGTIAVNQTVSYAALATLNVSFPNAHGLVPGDTFIVSITSDDGGSNNHALAGGSFFATEVPTSNTLRYQARTTGAIDISVSPVSGIVYPRPDSFFVHRPYDGGVQLGTGGPQHGAQAIRQSKKYIRYQSGKGIMYTTGALFAPSYDLQSVVAEDIEVDSLITVVTDDNDHGVQVGGVIRLLGIETEGYNSGPDTAVGEEFDYTVVSVVDERTFKVRSKRRLGATTAILGFGAQMSVVSWHGATVRSGIFDDQNGILWEFDGTQISAVQRTGTKQIAGTIALSQDSNLVTGTNTRFRDQLTAGDRIIIKGMTHVVTNVTNDTSCTITPDWRGVIDITGAKVALVRDKKAKQSEFNLDKLDGTGPSGYHMDIAKMQMIGIQYTWYGAGFIDWMVRGADGNFVFAHRMRNSNVNTEAFMRSGNLPVRYEVTNEGPPGKLKTAMTNNQTTIELEDSSFFPYQATVYIDNEVMTYTANNKATNTLTGVTRNASLLTFQAGAERSYTGGPATTHDARTGVIIISQTITPLISHWGSAFLTDGGFDEDRGYIFSYAETGIAVSTTKQTAFMMRLAPSVSNAITGDLGERELLNRAQLLLMGLEVTSESGSGGIVVEGVLNPQNYPLNPSDVNWSGLSGVAQGGQPSFAQIASGGGVTWTTGESATTANMTSVAALTAQVNSGTYSNWPGSRYVEVSGSDYRAVFGSNDINFVLGKSITGTHIPANTTIVDGYIPSSNNWGYFRLSKNTTGSIPGGSIDHYTIAYNAALVNKNYAYLTTASVDSAGTVVGTAITGISGGGTFPANTYVSNITSTTWASYTFYEISFNNAFTGTLALGSGTIEATFEQPPFAQPGETVFSFIAVPGERSTLDLAQLKELTNTPLGGRGTFPNGPDVLAINVYKVTGSDINSNIIIKWGEAQA